MDRDKSVHENGTPPRTWLVKTLSPLLFSAPDVHLKTFGKMWVDGIMHQAVWLDSIKKLNEEWTEFILYVRLQVVIMAFPTHMDILQATVLLNANVAFLAIQSVDIEKQEKTRSPAQVACYLSIVASLGSIILGLLLLRQNRTRAHGTTSDVLKFLQFRSHPTLGLETLAILYSLPYALLLWGMVSFLAGFAWNCFDASNTSTRVIMGAAWAAFGALVGWCVWMGWVHYEDSDRAAPRAEDVTDDDAGATDAKSDTGEVLRSEKHGSTRPGTDSRMSRHSGRPQSRLSGHLSAHGPTHTRPASRISQRSLMSGAHIRGPPMTPVREATMEPERMVDEEAGDVDRPSSTRVTRPMRSLFIWPANYPRFSIPFSIHGIGRNSHDSERTVTDTQGNASV